MRYCLPRVPPHIHTPHRLRRTSKIHLPPSRKRHGERLCQVQVCNSRRTRQTLRPHLSSVACVADRPEPATCPCSQGTNSSTHRARRDWRVGDPRRRERRFHSQPARRQNHRGKGRWHCLVNVPPFFQTVYPTLIEETHRTPPFAKWCTPW